MPASLIPFSWILRFLLIWLWFSGGSTGGHTNGFGSLLEASTTRCSCSTSSGQWNEVQSRHVIYWFMDRLGFDLPRSLLFHCTTWLFGFTLIHWNIKPELMSKTRFLIWNVWLFKALPAHVARHFLLWIIFYPKTILYRPKPKRCWVWVFSGLHGKCDLISDV